MLYLSCVLYQASNYSNKCLILRVNLSLWKPYMKFDFKSISQVLLEKILFKRFIPHVGFAAMFAIGFDCLGNWVKGQRMILTTCTLQELITMLVQTNFSARILKTFYVILCFIIFPYKKTNSTFSNEMSRSTQCHFK